MLDQRKLGGEGSPEWMQEVFQRSYCGREGGGGGGGGFERVCDLLEYGFSVLVYLPGNCMDAAAEYVKNKVGKREDWQEYGNHPGEGQSMDAAWQATTSISRTIKEWLSGVKTRRPDAIFKNLDRLFLDNNDGVIQNPGAQIALFSLIESTRGARTLGLVDREFGKLPESVEAAFAERIWLQEIDVERFSSLIPVELARKLMPEEPGNIPEGVAWLLAARLRWTDPVRATLIMRSIGEKSGARDLAGVLRRLREATRPIQFRDPRGVFPGDPEQIAGFSPATIELLRSRIIAPYQRWSRMSNPSRAECERQLGKLPPGILLYGPPGTGKSFLASWVARSLDLPIRVVAGAELRESSFGQTERNIVRLFREARQAAPCVLVLDDADDLLVGREWATGSTASADRAIVNTTLQELAGFGGRLAGVLVILTTNRFSSIDEAVRSRIPLHIPVPYPLNREQVREVTQTIAREYGFFLSQDMQARLIERFMQPVIRSTSARASEDEEERAQIRTNLFSPREIRQAMLLLEGNLLDSSVNSAGEDAPSSRYAVTNADVQRMEDYYEQLSRSPEMQEILG